MVQRKSLVLSLLGNTELAVDQVTVPLTAFESFVTSSRDSALVMLEAKNLFPSVFRVAVSCIKEVRYIT